MASFLDKLKIKTAIDNHVGLDLSCQHISTANFMQMNIAWTKELVPKEKISVNMETFTRLAPMPVPTFGRGKINNRAFFVPFRTIFPAWNDFITDAVHVYSAQDESGLVTHVPLISNLTLLNVLMNPDMSTRVVESEGAYDIEVMPLDDAADISGQTEFFKLTAKGRQFVKIIESLGYKIKYAAVIEDGGVVDQATLLRAEGNADLYEANANILGVYSALPLLAYLKVYHDWYYPSAYANLDLAEKMERMFKTDSPEGLKISSRTLHEIFATTHYVCYDSDYFVSAWDNPYNPSTGTYSSEIMRDPGATISIVSGTDEPLVTNTTSNYMSNLSQWAIDALKSMTDYMKRHQLVGARALDRYLARFGVNLTAEKLNRSVYLGSQSQNLQFGDVMSTSDTNGAALGDYAGKGISYGDGNFEFETDEYGIMIIVSTIIPQIGYVEGIDRNVMHVTKLDFYTPEFDNLGTQAIAKTELYIPQVYELPDGSSPAQGDMSGEYIANNNEVFGWTPRYAEYKIGRDKMTGDFRCNSINAGQSSWHLFREFKGALPTDLIHNVEFMQGADSDQYSRIFYNTDAEVADKFNVIYNFNVKSWSPMKSLFDTYEFDSKGKEVTEDVNGVKMN